jgi:hypothetical protein
LAFGRILAFGLFLVRSSAHQPRWLHDSQSHHDGEINLNGLASKLIVIYSKRSLYFREDCGIFCEGVKDDEGVFVKQQSANIPGAIKKRRRSSNSNDDATCVIFNENVSHRVDVASEHGDDYDNNNPLQRLILPLISTLEAEMQMVVNVFELAGACIFVLLFATNLNN